MFSAVSRRSLQLIVGALILIASSGCAVGNKHQYADATPNLQIENGHATAVSVQDRRPYVLDGDKDPDFVGVQRGGFGNPFDVTTASGKPLAADMSEAVVAALKKKNLTAVAVSVAPDATDAAIKEIIVSAPAERLLNIKLLEWKSDTYQNTALIYHVELSVLDSKVGCWRRRWLTGEMTSAALSSPLRTPKRPCLLRSAESSRACSTIRK
jgi:hypothetical protein